MKSEQLQKFYNMAEPRSENAIRKAKERKMERKEKQLLLADLCGRLPYGVFCNIGLDHPLLLQLLFVDKLDGILLDFYEDGKDYQVYLSEVKPYLRPMSSMTEEEKKEYNIFFEEYAPDDRWPHLTKNFVEEDLVSELIDWLNRKMFDFRGLIPEGLAEIAPEGMYGPKLLDYCLSSQNESDSVIDNATKITVGCKIRSKTKPIEILSIISDDCHGDEFECSNGTVLSLKQIEKYYELIK